MASNWFSNLGGILQQYAAGQNQPPADVEKHFDQLTQAAPAENLADALGAAFRSANTPPFAEMVSKLFSHSNPDQRAGLLNSIFSAFPPGKASEILSNLGLGNLGLGHGPVQARDTERLSPEDMQKIAAEAERHDPSVVDRASQFYAQHPFLVKMLGAAALSAMMAHVASHSR